MQDWQQDLQASRLISRVKHRPKEAGIQYIFDDDEYYDEDEYYDDDEYYDEEEYNEAKKMKLMIL